MEKEKEKEEMVPLQRCVDSIDYKMTAISPSVARDALAVAGSKGHCRGDGPVRGAGVVDCWLRLCHLGR